ncbi:histidine kinase dimerization/phospho-acceptor domain-containing protein [Chlorobium sp. KB01]|uniref:histidine kinase dimerization/phospho-acceptor domain-containing protein n=1 Tax=Chlorobium sp. KB01 TaxID=1917528 RepID=UPI000977CDA7|nr:histidine kinase dimerization/phospho-acceptor domain-containing protein [Chlorobium sp. KB01]
MLEARLRKSQRLETIGTLAGGIAHDFNNLLTPILGYAEMGVMSLSSEEPMHDYFNEIMLAAERARHLVSQILTFSKSQESTTAIVSVQAVIEEALKLLRPSIPVTIRIEQHIEKNCRNILADSSKLHQVIVNLSTNAFQAMEASGGVLTIELREIT